MDMDLERFADLLTGLIEKYANKIDLDSLPDPPRPEIDKISGSFACKRLLCVLRRFYVFMV